MALNTSKCNHLTPLPFKGLMYLRHFVAGENWQEQLSIRAAAKYSETRITVGPECQSYICIISVIIITASTSFRPCDIFISHLLNTLETGKNNMSVISDRRVFCDSAFLWQRHFTRFADISMQVRCSCSLRSCTDSAVFKAPRHPQLWVGRIPCKGPRVDTKIVKKIWRKPKWILNCLIMYQSQTRPKCTEN